MDQSKVMRFTAGVDPARVWKGGLAEVDLAAINSYPAYLIKPRLSAGR